MARKAPTRQRLDWLMAKCERLERERDAARERISELESGVPPRAAEPDEGPPVVSSQDIVAAMNAANESIKIADTIRNIVNQPLMDRKDVQSRLLTALQAFDRSGVERQRA